MKPTKKNRRAATGRTSEASRAWRDPRVIVASVSAVIAVGAAGSSWMSARDARLSGAQAAAVGTHLEFQKRFQEVARTIPDPYRFSDPPPPAKDSKAWRALSRYWYLAFEEWLATKRLGNATLAEYWDQNYRDLIATQLNKRAYRAVLCSLIREKFSQSALQREFGGMYADLYSARTGKKLCAESEPA